MSQIEKHANKDLFNDITEIESEQEILKPVKVPSLSKSASLVEDKDDDITTIDQSTSSLNQIKIKEYYAQLSAFFSKATIKIRELFNPRTSWDHHD